MLSRFVLVLLLLCLVFSGVVQSQLTVVPAPFDAAQTLSQYTQSNQLVIADINADGFSDLVTGDIYIDGLGVTVSFGSIVIGTNLLNQQAFSPPIILGGVTYGAAAIAVGDINADGLLDIVACSNFEIQTAPFAYYFLNQGGGKFSALQLIPALPSQYVSISSILAFDLNSDGNLDLVFASGNFAAWWENVGSNENNVTYVGPYVIGNVTNNCIHDTDNQYCLNQIAVGDLDNDNIQDIVVTGRLVYWYRTSTNANNQLVFTPALLSAVASVSVVILQANPDANRNLYIAFVTDYYLIVMTNQQNSSVPAFTSPYQDPYLYSTLQTGCGNPSIAAADINGDGYTDLITNCNRFSNYSSSSIAVYYNNGAGGFVPYIVGPLMYAAAIVAADVDNDGNIDIMTAGMGVNYFHNANQVVFSTTPTVLSTLGFNVIPYFITACDFNGDGWIDVIAATEIGLYWSRNYDNAAFSPALVPLLALVSGGEYVQCGDINGDGNLDLVYHQYDQPDAIVWSEGLGLNGLNITKNPIETTDATPYETMVIVSLLTPGVNDVVASLNNYGEDYGFIAVYYNNGFGQFTRVVLTQNAVGAGLALQDFDQDFLIDIAFCEVSTGYGYWMKNLGNQSLGNQSFSAPKQVYNSNGASIFSIFTADIDGDGLYDLSVNIQGVISWFRQLGNGVFEMQARQVGLCEESTTFYLGDLDGNSLPDFLIQCDGYRKLIRNLGSYFSSATVITADPLVWIAYAVVDVNGDGNPDLLSSLYSSDQLVASYNLGLILYIPAQLYNYPDQYRKYTLNQAGFVGPNEVPIVLSSYCYQAHGGSLRVVFENNIWYGSLNMFDSVFNPSLLSCNMVFSNQNFTNSSDPSRLFIPCINSGSPCISIGRLPPGRSISFDGVNMTNVYYTSLQPQGVAIAATMPSFVSLVITRSFITGGLSAVVINDINYFLIAGSTLMGRASNILTTQSTVGVLQTVSFKGVSSYGNGGCASIVASSVNFYNSSFSGCSVDGFGGAIMISQSPVILSNCDFSSTSAAKGGAIYFTGGSSLVVNSTTFTNTNASLDGGAIYIDYSSGGLGSVVISSCQFNNTLALGGLGRDIYFFDAASAPVFYNQPLPPVGTFQQNGIFVPPSQRYPLGSRLSEFIVPNLADATQARSSFQPSSLLVWFVDQFQGTTINDNRLATLAGCSLNATNAALANQIALITAGSCTFNNYQLIGEPGTIASLSVSSVPYSQGNTVTLDLGAVELLPCQLGQQIYQGQCVNCAAGSISTVLNSNQCTTCPKGTSAINNGTQCSTCLPGTYTYLDGSSSCLTCPINTYTVTFGSTGCIICPSTFNCSSTSGLPSANTGYWMSINFTSGQTLVSRCPSDWCQEAQDQEPYALAAVSQPNNCKIGHLPTPMCGKCDNDSGFFLWDGDCRPCDADGIGVIFLYVFMFLWLLWIFFCSPGEKDTGLMGSLIFFFQTLGLISTSYESGLSTVPSTSWINIANLELILSDCPRALLHPDQPTFYVYFWLKLVQPLVMLGMLALIYIFALGNRLIFAAAASPDESNVAPSASFFQRISASLFDNSSLHDRAVKAVAAIFIFCYTPIIKTLLLTCHCVSLYPSDINPNLTSSPIVLAIDPSISCDDPVYRGYLAFAIVSLVVFGLLPIYLYLGVIVPIIRAKGNVKEEQLRITAQRQFGMVMNPYRFGKSWWFLLNEYRKVVILLIWVFTTFVVTENYTSIDLQDTLLAIAFLAFLFWHVRVHPNSYNRAFYLETLSLIFLVFAVQTRQPLQIGFYFTWIAVSVFLFGVVIEIVYYYKHQEEEDQHSLKVSRNPLLEPQQSLEKKDMFSSTQHINKSADTELDQYSSDV